MPVAPAPSEPMLFDPAPLAQLVADVGPVAAERVVGLFLKMSADYLKALDEHHKSNNAEGFKRAAHSLKSSARAVGGAQVAATAYALEQGGPSTYGAIRPGLQDQMANVVKILGAWRP